MANVGDGLDESVAAAVEGDPQAVERLLAAIRPLVVRYCRARVGRQERSFASADDVAQEVCLAVLTALPSYRDQGRPFLAFVYGIAQHKVADAHRAALLHADRATRLDELLVRVRHDLALDVGGDPLGLLLVPVQEQPPGALGHVPTDDQDAHGQDRPESEGQPPAELGGDHGRVQQGDGQQCAARGTDPERPVDGHVHAAAVLRGDQLVNRGVDGGVLCVVHTSRSLED